MKEALAALLSSSSGALTLESILLNFFVAAVLGVMIYMSYMMSHAGAMYSVKFNVSLIMLTLTTTLIMNVIGNNITLSLGMVGALSIVRFRTAIKDPRDTTYIFWCIAVGICCGVSEYLIAGIGSGVIFLFMVLFGSVKNSERYLLIVRGTKDDEQQAERIVEQWFDRKVNLRVKNTTGDTVELIYELSQRVVLMNEKQKGPVSEALYKLGTVSAVNLVCQNDEINR